jgi:hypothetical protein
MHICLQIRRRNPRVWHRGDRPSDRASRVAITKDPNCGHPEKPRQRRRCGGLSHEFVFRNVSQRQRPPPFEGRRPLRPPSISCEISFCEMYLNRNTLAFPEGCGRSAGGRTSRGALRSRSANSNSALHPQAPTATARWRCDPGASAALSQAKAYSRGMHLGRPLPRRRVRRLKGCPLIAPTGSRSPAPRLRSFQETAPARSTRRLPQQRHEP